MSNKEKADLYAMLFELYKDTYSIVSENSSLNIFFKGGFLDDHEYSFLIGELKNAPIECWQTDQYQCCAQYLENRLSHYQNLAENETI